MNAPPPALGVPRITLGILWLVGIVVTTVWVMIGPVVLAVAGTPVVAGLGDIDVAPRTLDAAET